MKTLLKTLTVVAFVTILTGCANTKLQQNIIEKQNDGIAIIKTRAQSVDNDNLSAKENIHLGYRNDLKSVLKKASEYTLQNGFTHFVILSKGTNNLNGFPLNSFHDMDEYCNASYLTDDAIKSKCGNFMSYGDLYNKLKILPLNNPSYMISAFNAEDTLKETNK